MCGCHLDKSYATAGKMKAPDKRLCLELVKQAWKSATSEVIVFKACGISNNTDGSEDDPSTASNRAAR